MDIQDICMNYEKYESLYEEVRGQITENNLEFDCLHTFDVDDKYIDDINADSEYLFIDLFKTRLYNKHARNLINNRAYYEQLTTEVIPDAYTDSNQYDFDDIKSLYDIVPHIIREIILTRVLSRREIQQSRQRKCAYCDCVLLESDNTCPGCEEYVGDTIISNNTVQSSSSPRSLMRCVYCNSELSTDDIHCPICDAVIEKVRGNRFQEKWRCEKCAFENDQCVSKCCGCEDNDDEDNTTVLTNQLKENDNVSVDEDENTSANALSHICDFKDRSLSGNTNSGRDEYKDIPIWSLVQCTCTNLRDAELYPYTRQAHEWVVVSTANYHTFSDEQESINEPRDSNEEITPLEHTVAGNEEDMSPVEFNSRRENKVSELDASQNVNLHEYPCLHDSSESRVFSSVNAECIGSTNTDEVNDTANEDPSFQTLYYSDDNEGRYDHSWNYKRNSIDNNRNCSVKLDCAPQCHDIVITRDRDVGNCEDDDEESLRNVCDMTKEISLQSGSEGDTAGINDNSVMENEDDNKCADVFNPMSDSKNLSFAGNDVMNSDHTNSIGNKVKDNSTWICIHCSFCNLLTTEICVACNKYAHFVETWQCDYCTFKNRKSSIECSECRNKNEYWQVCEKCNSVMINLRFNEVCDKCLQENIERSYQDQLKTENDIRDECEQQENVKATCDQIEEYNNEKSTENAISNVTAICEGTYINAINPESLKENSGINICSVDRELPRFDVCGTDFSSRAFDENDGYFGDGGNDSNLNLGKKEDSVDFKDEWLSKTFGYNSSKTTITTADTGVKDDHDGNEVNHEGWHTRVPNDESLAHSREDVEDDYELISKEEIFIP